MNGAIFFSGQYGSTAQYANWVGEATGFPVFDINNGTADPSDYDFVILGSSVIVYKLTIRKWVQKNLSSLLNRPVILFTVSGAPAGPKLDDWIVDSLPEELRKKMQHVALRGRLDLKRVSWWVRLILRIGAWKNDDTQAKKEELEGFDYMDKSSIEPVINMLQKLQSDKTK